jgi:hypothetical protein
LLSHAVELALKAYIVRCVGLTDKQLSEEFRHNLIKPLNRCVQLGLPIRPEVISELGKLSEAHEKYWARYPIEEATQVFVIEQFEPFVEELFAAIRLKLGYTARR